MSINILKKNSAKLVYIYIYIYILHLRTFVNVLEYQPPVRNLNQRYSENKSDALNTDIYMFNI